MSNGVDMTTLREFIGRIEREPSAANRDASVVATWRGGLASEVTFASGERPLHAAADGHAGGMKMLLASLAACEVELVAVRAALLGVRVQTLTVEATGDFDLHRYLGLGGDLGAGYDKISYTVRLKTDDATPDQLDALHRACERDSPVGESLRRGVPLTVRFEAS